MLERAKIRCPICRSSVPAVVVWAAADACPRCGTALTLKRPSISDGPRTLGARRRMVSPPTESRRGRPSTGGIAVAPARQAPATSTSVPPHLSSDRIVSRWAQAFNARDLDGMLACVAERIDLHPLRLRGLATRYRGRDGVREWFAHLQQGHHEYRIAVCQVRDLGAGKVFASGLLSLGDETDIGPVCMLHQHDGGMIVSAREYLSDPDTIERLGLIP